MKFSLDQNLSRHLVGALEESFPGTAHVAVLGLDRAADEVVWQHAARAGFVIATKDADFYQRSMLRGFPPKIVWLTLGNCSTREVKESLLESASELEAFVDDPNQSTMILGRTPRHDPERSPH